MTTLPENIRDQLRSLPREVLIKKLLSVRELQKRAIVRKNTHAYEEKYYNDPFQWVNDFVTISLADYHLDALKMIKDGCNKIAIFGPHGLGKSVFAALLILWAGSVSPDCKVITTASAWRQLEAYLWPEVHKWYGKVDWKKVERAGGNLAPRLLTLECNFSVQSKAFAVASDNPLTIEGAHAKRIVYIFDEAKAIPAGIWESADGAFSTPGDHLQVALSTPGDTSGVFYSICSRQKGYEKWKVRHVTLREAIRAGRVTLEWAREKREAWGKDSIAYQTRVLGIFATDSPEAIIPFSWVELAVNRWKDWKEKGSPLNGKLVIGADTAGQGVDKTSFFYRVGKIGTRIERYKKSRPMELAGKLKNALGPKGLLNIDVSYGEGAGTANRLQEFDGFASRINPVNFSARTEKTDRTGIITFINVRALMWWNMREMLDPENDELIALPDDELLIGDLVAVRRLPLRSDGKLQIESKDDIRKRLGRSTDDGDSCCLAFYLDHYEGLFNSYDLSAMGTLD
jgi:hypothetical protein